MADNILYVYATFQLAKLAWVSIPRVYTNILLFLIPLVDSMKILYCAAIKKKSNHCQNEQEEYYLLLEYFYICIYIYNVDKNIKSFCL